MGWCNCHIRYDLLEQILGKSTLGQRVAQQVRAEVMAGITGCRHPACSPQRLWRQEDGMNAGQGKDSKKIAPPMNTANGTAASCLTSGEGIPSAHVGRLKE